MLTRRFFMRAAPGALAAAPLAAKEAASAAANAAVLPGPPTTPYPRGYYSGSATPAGVSPSMEHMLERRARLEAEARGEFCDNDLESGPPQDLIALHYDSLRSLSPVARNDFAHARHRQRSIERRKSWAQKQLAELLKNWSL